MSPRWDAQDTHRRGFTVVELMVSMAIVGLLIAVTLPAVQQSRQQARSLACKSNLSQLGKATHSFHATRNRFPMESEWQAGEFAGYIDSVNTSGGQWPALFACPSDNRVVSDRMFSSTYLSNSGNLKPNRGLGFSQILSSQSITDGLSNTACMSERLNPSWTNPVNAVDDIRTDYHFVSRQWPDLSYHQQFADDCRAATRVARALFISHGLIYTHVLPPNGKSCYNMSGYNDRSSYLITTPSSHHPGGVNLLMCDGAVRWASDSISQDVWMNIGSVAGGETENDF